MQFPGGVLSKNFQEYNFAGVFFTKVSGFQPATLLKKELQERQFLVKFVKHKKTIPILQNNCKILLASLLVRQRLYVLKVLVCSFQLTKKKRIRITNKKISKLKKVKDVI